MHYACQRRAERQFAALARSYGPTVPNLCIRADTPFLSGGQVLPWLSAGGASRRPRSREWRTEHFARLDCVARSGLRPGGGVVVVEVAKPAVSRITQPECPFPVQVLFQLGIPSTAA